MWRLSVATLTWSACCWTGALRLMLKHGWVSWKTELWRCNIILVVNYRLIIPIKWELISKRRPRYASSPSLPLFLHRGQMFLLLNPQEHKNDQLVIIISISDNRCECELNAVVVIWAGPQRVSGLNSVSDWMDDLTLCGVLLVCGGSQGSRVISCISIPTNTNDIQPALVAGRTCVWTETWLHLHYSS